MNNSIIIGGIMKFMKFVERSYLQSKFHELFVLADNFLKKCTLNSNLTKILTKPYDNQTLNDSKTYKINTYLLNLLKKLKPFFSKYILNSNIVYLFKDLIEYIENKPFKVISLLGISFFGSNILFSFFINNVNFKIILVKLILLFMFIVIGRINLSFKKLFSTSSFYRFFKWIISYKD